MWHYTNGVKGFLVAYRTVFAPCGSLNPVTKDKKIELIKLAESCAEQFEMVDDYGDVETGFINIKNIRKLYYAVIKNIKCF